MDDIRVLLVDFDKPHESGMLIRQEAFFHQVGKKVPILYDYNLLDPSSILGFAELSYYKKSEPGNNLYANIHFFDPIPPDRLPYIEYHIWARHCAISYAEVTPLIISGDIQAVVVDVSSSCPGSPYKTIMEALYNQSESL